MNNLKAIIPLLMLIATLAACRNEGDNTPDPQPAPVYPSYFPLKSGNYWIYRRFNLSAAGNLTPTNILDSCYIAKDTTIKHQTYFKYVAPRWYDNGSDILFLRDSLHYLVDHKGKIHFSSQDFSRTFSTKFMMAGQTDTLAKITTAMTDRDFPVTTAAGSFITSNFQQTFSFYPIFRDTTPVRHLNTRYAKGVGIITEVLPFYLSDPDYLERRLERYRLN